MINPNPEEVAHASPHHVIKMAALSQEFVVLEESVIGFSLTHLHKKYLLNKAHKFE